MRARWNVVRIPCYSSFQVCVTDKKTRDVANMNVGVHFSIYGKQVNVVVVLFRQHFVPSLTIFLRMYKKGKIGQ